MVLIPISVFYFLIASGKLNSVIKLELAERKYPLVINILLLLVLIQNTFTLERTPELFFFFCGGLISTLFALFFLYLNRKISLHMIGISSLTTFMLGFSLKFQIPFTATFGFLMVLHGLLGSSRLQMKAHKLYELLAGLLCGLLPQLFFWIYWL